MADPIKMFRLGLTGSMATGKSTALADFAEEGLPVFSADAAVHELYAGEAVAPVEALFPGVAKNGVIDRDELSTRLLANPGRIPELEAAVHPLVRARMHRFFVEAEQSGADIAVIDIPLLFETGYDYGVDAIAVTSCPPETQRSRALARPGMTEQKLDAILARQMPQDEKRARADFIIDTGGTRAETRAQVGAIVARCRQMLYDSQP